jgi:hypothetical protein
MGSSSRIEVIENWGERRCDLDIILTAFTYKPTTDTRSGFEFAGDNFKYCISSKSTDYLETLFAALFEVLRKQMGAADIMTQVMKTLRLQLNRIYEPFSSMMNKFWNKFKQIGSLSSRIFQHLYMSMKKASATAVASVFVAISLQTAVMNGIDLVINIIMIVLYILMALSIIFFLPIIPVFVFVFMATAGIEQIFPGRTGGMGEVFCFAPGTQVYMKDGSKQNIQDLHLGDLLLNGQTVEAVIELPKTSEDLYSLDGVYVSGDHRVWYNYNWIFVKNHPQAQKTRHACSSLWTLITSNRIIPVLSNSRALLFADWEEIPSTEEAAREWESIVLDVLSLTRTVAQHVPQDPPCFDRSIRVMKYQAGWTQMSDIVKGDWIMGEYRWTRVIGICKREVEGGIGKKGQRITDGVWIKRGVGEWSHPTGESDRWKWQGLNLITDSGTFVIRLDKELVVRDFTEVGWMNLSKTYTRVEAGMSAVPIKKV